MQFNRLSFLAVAAIFHFSYIWSIFDIYFVSPIVHGMRHHSAGIKSPAKRLFFIVGDGFRADKCFQAHTPPFLKDGEDSTRRPLAPFLRSRVLEVGSFGVSHTRMPTESRPGHVALIAGLYEDVSAVTTGWKLNPVNFDSVFNQSRHTWSWGSPDILPMFREGATPGRVDAFSYSEEDEDFTADATKLDTWVFDHVKDFFTQAAGDDKLRAAVNEDKVVFFLHLLGLDSTGHGFRPYSQEYLRNIQVVDAGVQELVASVEEFYGNDGKTAWVFTADHGMSDWGSHGDGHPDNTRTPLIAWGAGIRGPDIVADGAVASGHDEFSSDWNLDHVRRVDVDQADVAALMAHLIGVEYPVNSVGVLPLEYLDASDEEKARSIFANALQILEMFKVKEANKMSTQINFVPFAPLHGRGLSSQERVDKIKSLITSQDYDAATSECKDLISASLQGLRYMQTYDWLFLRTLVTLGYLGWILFALAFVIQQHFLDNAAMRRWSSPALVGFLSTLTGLFAVIYVQQSPWTYYMYAFAPVFFWWQVWLSRDALIVGIPLLAQRHGPHRYAGLLMKSFGFLIVLEAIVYGYFHREIFTACFVLGLTWPWFYGKVFVKRNSTTVFLWSVSCLAMSVFTLLPVIKVESLFQIHSAGSLMLAAGVGYIAYGHRLFAANVKTIFNGKYMQFLLGFQCGLIALSMAVTHSSVKSIQAKQGLPFGNQVVGWCILGLSLLALPMHRFTPLRHYQHQLMVIFLSFSPTFIILTISYEGLFYVSFCAMLATWVQMEYLVYQQINSTKEARAKNEGVRALDLGDNRIALFFFFFIQAGFFGTGNVASLSSFSLESVCRLIPIFNPFSMTALLVFKLLIPFAIISANLGVLNRIIHAPPSALFMIVMSITDVLTLNFFYMVKDEGSWLDIGTTISHFVIASLLCVFVAALEPLSGLFVGGPGVGEVKERKE
ncbi:Glycosyl phosphatidyl inositol anchor synthesis, variant 2 [Orbilia oligospora]|uniref:GPI ethanolamine phosphate transferase 1 n=2 Tax=Orbilia oligospora TaxID=2813651 RepID=A0A7C8J4E6_ORBOL|nr:Glycosyl phosphatidyl inositol anchor synthesis, variant 2 [Orbilia oligospora]KAF3084757.1 Glycosyl phosphatidyl inositol anchor synthesis, variant 2 [Orbilia oligospora]KAF3093628.1 Glycosyl phosphatidyl inositol anchor synthesis, variant 2 [Orbilia oligospora]KAF3125354.1 Glycosyl phosphatidyl inositol anchor synthesis, variant 2 [Orbilia oligospora]